MRLFYLFIWLILVCSFTSLAKRRALYNSLDPQSVSEHLAFYELYANESEGQQALKHAWKLLSGEDSIQGFHSNPTTTFRSAIDGIIALVNKQPNKYSPKLSEEELDAINRLAQRLPNRHLKGYHATTEKEVLALDPEEIDLARGLFLSESEEDIDTRRTYEAMIDLMALQILTQTSLDASPEEKIHVMNSFIFDDMGFRFPPHSQYAKDVDLYTFLPSVLDSRKGVCLGVSILYLCLGQRLDLPLEIITPPGHIYVRYRNGEQIINIETTARGIHLDSEVYLGIDTRSLQQRNIKEVIGFSHFNQAGAYWSQENHEKVLDSYQKAKKYTPDDMLLKELMGYAYVIVGETMKGKKLLEEVQDHIPDYAVSGQTVAKDYLNGHATAEGMKVIFKQVDEKRQSVLEKKEAIEAVLKETPKFRAGIFSLATTWLQLHRQKEALKVLEKYHALEPNDPTAEYYLAILYLERYDDNKAWEHLKNAEVLVKARDHQPKALEQLRHHLSLISPE